MYGMDQVTPIDAVAVRDSKTARSGVVEGVVRLFDLWGAGPYNRGSSIAGCQHEHALSEPADAAEVVMRSLVALLADERVTAG